MTKMNLRCSLPPPGQLTPAVVPAARLLKLPQAPRGVPSGPHHANKWIVGEDRAPAVTNAILTCCGRISMTLPGLSPFFNRSGADTLDWRGAVEGQGQVIQMPARQEQFKSMSIFS